MIGIIDYGAGNLKSLQNALAYLHQDTLLCEHPKQCFGVDRLILPGVGAFPDCMKQLHKQNLVEAIHNAVERNIPLLGICLGMQVLFESGTEVEPCQGLGLLKGSVVHMDSAEVKIPHIGWNDLMENKCDQMLNGLHHPYVYYVHSYYAQGYDENDLVATSTYGNLVIPGAFRKGHIWACQFHPEKSGHDGLRILQNFIDFENKEYKYE